VRPLSFVKSFAVSQTGFRLELEGGHVFEYRQQQEPTDRPSLPPPTFTTTGEPVEEAVLGLAKTRPALRVVRRTEAA
jgi:hypothetical protein